MKASKMKKYRSNYIIFGVCLLISAIKFFGMFDGVVCYDFIGFETYGLLTLVVTANLSWFVATLRSRGEEINEPHRIIFIVFSVGNLLFLMWIIGMFYLWY